MAFISAGGVNPLPGPSPEVGGSFDELYKSTRPTMVRLASLLVASRAEGEELVQDAYIELFRQWDAVERPAAFLRTLIVRHCARSRWRRRTELGKLQIVGRSDDPYIRAICEPEIDTALAFVQRLKPDQRAVVVLRFYADMSHTQIADALGCSVVAVRTRLHRALGDLRKDMR